MMKLTHKTTDTNIEAHNRDELKTVLVECWGYEPCEVNKMNKAQRVERCTHIRNELLATANGRADYLETQRQAKLETERKNPVYCAAINVLHQGVEKRRDELVGIITEWQARVATSDPLSVVWNTESGIKGMMFASAYAGRLQHVVSYLAKQCDDRTHTTTQIMGHLKDDANELAKACMNDETYNHNSTCELDSVKSREEFKALQHAARFMAQAVDAFDRDLKTDNPEDVGYGKYIGDSRCW